MQPLKEAKFSVEQLAELFSALIQHGYDLIGPTLDGKAITYDILKRIEDLPKGWTDEQECGHYRLKKRPDGALFGYNIGSRSFKQFLFPPRETLLTMREDNSVQTVMVKPESKFAFIGVRACELNAILIQDKVFNSDKHPDPRYRTRRQNAFIVALNCHTTTQTCFCVSMKTGPEVSHGYDLALSEIITKQAHYFICEAGSDKGLAILEKITCQELDAMDRTRKQEMVAQTISNMGRKLDTTDIKQKLYDAHDHPHWDVIAERCINCANCTLACPTCFCGKIEDEVALDQKTSTRTRTWDSCFSQAHSYIHESFVRESASQRYRQWMTHKLASWEDQFDTSGCVGCGRCLTWCPVGIDITQEILHFSEDYENEKNS